MTLARLDRRPPCPRAARRPLLTCALVAALLMAFAPLPADATTDSVEALRERADRAQALNEADDAQRAEWAQTYRNLLEAQREARERLDTARHAHRSAKKRKRLRGEVRTDLEAEIQKAEGELSDATHDVNAFLDHARQEGVAQSWLDTIAEEFGRPASPR